MDFNALYCLVMGSSGIRNPQALGEHRALQQLLSPSHHHLIPWAPLTMPHNLGSFCWNLVDKEPQKEGKTWPGLDSTLKARVGLLGCLCRARGWIPDPPLSLRTFRILGPSGIN